MNGAEEKEFSESSYSSLELSYLEQTAYVCMGTRSCGVY